MAFSGITLSTFTRFCLYQFCFGETQPLHPAYLFYIGAVFHLSWNPVWENDEDYKQVQNRDIYRMESAALRASLQPNVGWTSTA